MREERDSVPIACYIESSSVRERKGFVTLPNSNVSTNAAGTALTLTRLLNSGFKGGDGITAAQLKKDPRGFEQWCREQGLLIEINDADYAEPKLAVVS